MKIECDICQTVFLIDDNLISEKGIKAQCPRCGDQKVVRRPAADASVGEPAAFSNAPLFQFTNENPNFGSNMAPSGGYGSVPLDPGGSYSQEGFGSSGGFGLDDGSGMFGAELTCFKCGRPIHESTDSVLPVCENCRGESFIPIEKDEYDLPTTSTPPNDYQRNNATVAQYHQDEAPYSPFGGGGDNNAFSSPEYDYIPSTTLPPSDYPPAMDFAPPPIDDYSMEEPMESGVEGRLDPTWIKIRRLTDGQEVGPISLAEVRSLYVHGKLTFDDQYAGRDGHWMPIHQVPELLVILRRTPQLNTAGKGPQKARKSMGAVMWLLALLLLGGGGGTAWLIWSNTPDKTGPTPPPRSVNKSAPSRLLTEKVSQWRRQYPNVKPNPKQSRAWTQQGMTALQLDQAQSYTQAIDLFSRSLVADIKNTRALAGYCIATSWSPTRRESSARRISECASILRNQVRRKATPLLLAVYALYLARRGASSTARQTAQKAAKKAPRDAFIQLILAEILLNQQKSPNKIERTLKLALKANSELARAHLHVARSAMQNHHYYQAEQSLMLLDKQSHPDGLYLLAQFYNAQGDFVKSSKTLQKLIDHYPKHLKGWLMLAIIRYQILNDRKKAQKQLENPPALGTGIEPPVTFKKKRLLHLSILELMAGKFDEVRANIKTLKQLESNYLPALFLQVQLLAKEKKHSSAEKRMKAISSQLSMPEFQTFYAFLQMRSGQTEAAIRSLRQQMDDHANLIWPRLVLPAIYLQQKQNDLALITFKKALEVEPNAISYTRTPTDFYIIPELWYSLTKDYTSAKVSREERAITMAGAGLVAYHSGRMQSAYSFLQRARGIDRNGLASNLYIAQYHYDRGQYKQANDYARRVYQNHDQHALSGLILAWVAYHRQQREAAKQLFQAVRKEKPWFLSARIGEAMVLSELKDREGASDLLKKMLASQYSHHLLTRALYNAKW